MLFSWGGLLSLCRYCHVRKHLHYCLTGVRVFCFLQPAGSALDSLSHSGGISVRTPESQLKSVILGFAMRGFSQRSLVILAKHLQQGK